MLTISELVEQQSLDVQFGIAPTPLPPAGSLTGLYVIALQPVQFTANQITAYPLTVNGKRSKVDERVPATLWRRRWLCWFHTPAPPTPITQRRCTCGAGAADIRYRQSGIDSGSSAAVDDGQPAGRCD